MSTASDPRPRRGPPGGAGPDCWTGTDAPTARRMSRHAGWAAWKAETGLFFPSWRFLLDLPGSFVPWAGSSGRGGTAELGGDPEGEETRVFRRPPRAGKGGRDRRRGVKSNHEEKRELGSKEPRAAPLGKGGAR